MIISKEYKFIFCHAAKTGGSSIRRALQKYHSFDRYSPALDNKGAIFDHAHLHVAMEYISPDEFTNFLKFGCVRNPWSLEVSRYFYIKKQFPMHPLSKMARDLDFRSWVEWLYNERDGEMGIIKYFIIDGEMKLDHIIKCERFEEGFNSLCNKLNLPQMELPHANKTDHIDYKKYYNKEARDLVAKSYQHEIDMFKYTFDS